jgi:hypothetical protein
MLEEEISKKFRSDTAGSSDHTTKVQSFIDKFVELQSVFDQRLTDWVIQTYQPLHACQHPSFRAMCSALNLKAPSIGLYQMQSLLSNEVACARIKLRSILRVNDVCVCHNRCLDFLLQCDIHHLYCTLCARKDMGSSPFSSWFGQKGR